MFALMCGSRVALRFAWRAVLFLWSSALRVAVLKAGMGIVRRRFLALVLAFLVAAGED